MKIEEAQEQNGKAWLPDDKTSKLDEYVISVGGVMTWFGSDDAAINPVAYCLLKRTDWQPFPEAKEIRPEKAGELWATGDLNYMTQKIGDELRMIPRSYDMQILEEIDHFIHGVGCYKRLYPPVEDDSVERIEIEGVVWT